MQNHGFMDSEGNPESKCYLCVEIIRKEFKCLGNCPICGKCNFLRGREAEGLYAAYIEGRRSFRDITAEHRNIGHPFRT